MAQSKEVTIGTLAAETGCTVPTIRYYEAIGLLPHASRRAGGHRIYRDADLQRLSFIRRCRDFGFSIEQVRDFVTLLGSPQRDCIAARDLTKRHLDAIRGKLKQLRALERDLKALVVDCNAQCVGGPAEACVILEDLALPKSGSCCGPG